MSRFYFEADVFVDLDEVQFAKMVVGTSGTAEIDFKNGTSILLCEDHGEVLKALRAYRNPPAPALPPSPKQHPRAHNAPWLTQRQKYRISAVMESFGPNPLKPGVIVTPDALVIKPGTVENPDERLAEALDSQGEETKYSGAHQVVVGGKVSNAHWTREDQMHNTVFTASQRKSEDWRRIADSYQDTVEKGTHEQQ